MARRKLLRKNFTDVINQVRSGVTLPEMFTQSSVLPPGGPLFYATLNLLSQLHFYGVLTPSVFSNTTRHWSILTLDWIPSSHYELSLRPLKQTKDLHSVSEHLCMNFWPGSSLVWTLFAPIAYMHLWPRPNCFLTRHEKKSQIESAKRSKCVRRRAVTLSENQVWIHLRDTLELQRCSEI